MKKGLKEHMISAALSALTVLIISFYICFVFAGNDLLEKDIPLILFAAGILVFLLGKKLFHMRDSIILAVSAALSAVMGIIAAICL